MKRLVGLGILGALIASGAEAQTCGANITTNTVLTGDMNCSASLTSGLVLQAGITLDCGGHSIVGPGGAVGQQTGFYGIYVRAPGATVRNCHVSGYEVGIRVRAASNSVIVNNVSENNLRYGMELTNTSSNVLVDSNLMQGNGLRGLHLSGGSANTLVHNTFLSQGQGVQLLNTNGNVIRENTFSDHTTQGIQTRTSGSNRIEGNSLVNDPIQLTLQSVNNILDNNYILDEQLLIDTGSNNNSVTRMTVQRTASDPSVPAYSVQGSTGITVLDSEVCGNVNDHVFAATGANASFQRFFVLEPPVRVNADATSTVSMDASGTPIRCAIPMSMDIDDHPINTVSNKPVNVTIFTTSSFDAATIDPSSACFGDADNASNRDCEEHDADLKDVDHDGDLDLEISFESRDLGLVKGDTQACFTASTTDGHTVWGCGAVQVKK